MRRFIILLPLLILLMCSWVDRDTIDTYHGSIVFRESSYDVSNLSGDIEYYLMSYANIGLSDDGSLLNGSPNSVKGYALINGVEYPIQIPSNGGLQIQQEYLSNMTYRTTWVSYDLYPDVIPSAFSLSELAPIFVVFLLFLLIPFIIPRGILT